MLLAEADGCGLLLLQLDHPLGQVLGRLRSGSYEECTRLAGDLGWLK